MDNFLHFFNCPVNNLESLHVTCLEIGSPDWQGSSHMKISHLLSCFLFFMVPIIQDEEQGMLSACGVHLPTFTSEHFVMWLHGSFRTNSRGVLVVKPAVKMNLLSKFLLYLFWGSAHPFSKRFEYAFEKSVFVVLLLNLSIWYGHFWPLEYWIVNVIWNMKGCF